MQGTHNHHAHKGQRPKQLNEHQIDQSWFACRWLLLLLRLLRLRLMRLLLELEHLCIVHMPHAPLVDGGEQDGRAQETEAEERHAAQLALVRHYERANGGKVGSEHRRNGVPQPQPQVRQDQLSREINTRMGQRHGVETAMLTWNSRSIELK